MCLRRVLTSCEPKLASVQELCTLGLDTEHACASSDWSGGTLLAPPNPHASALAAVTRLARGLTPTGSGRSAGAAACAQPSRWPGVLLPADCRRQGCLPARVLLEGSQVSACTLVVSCKLCLVKDLPFWIWRCCGRANPRIVAEVIRCGGGSTNHHTIGEKTLPGD